MLYIRLAVCINMVIVSCPRVHLSEGSSDRVRVRVRVIARVITLTLTD